MDFGTGLGEVPGAKLRKGPWKRSWTGAGRGTVAIASLTTVVGGMGGTEGQSGMPITPGRPGLEGGGGSVGLGSEPDGPGSGRSFSDIGRHGILPARWRRALRGISMGMPSPGWLFPRLLLPLPLIPSPLRPRPLLARLLRPGALSRGAPGLGFRKGRRETVCGWRETPIVGAAGPRL